MRAQQETCQKILCRALCLSEHLNHVPAGEGREGIRMYCGDFEGIPLRLIDTPGLEVSQAEMGSNLEKLGKIK